jgi:hypothetical protein
VQGFVILELFQGDVNKEYWMNSPLRERFLTSVNLADSAAHREPVCGVFSPFSLRRGLFAGAVFQSGTNTSTLLKLSNVHFYGPMHEKS